MFFGQPKPYCLKLYSKTACYIFITQYYTKQNNIKCSPTMKLSESTEICSTYLEELLKKIIYCLILTAGIKELTHPGKTTGKEIYINSITSLIQTS